MAKCVIRPYRESDHPGLLRLLQQAGMVELTKVGEDLVRRAHSLADAIFIADDGSGRPLGMIALFQRSPQALWGTDFVTDSQRAETFFTALSLWRATLLYASDNGFSWIGTQPRTGDRRIRQFYRLMGLLDVGSHEMETPMPMCYRIWKDIGDVGLFPPRFEANDAVIRFYGRSSVIEINRRAGVVTCHDRDCASRERSRNKAFAMLRTSDELTRQCCSNVVIDRSMGNIRFLKGHLVILSPWWTPVPATRIQLPVRDKWPWESVSIPEGILRLVQAKRNGSEGIVFLRHVHAGHIVQFEGPVSAPYLRITIESTQPPKYSGRTLSLPQFRVHLEEHPHFLEHHAWNSYWRTHIHFVSPVVHFRVYATSPEEQK